MISFVNPLLKSVIYYFLAGYGRTWYVRADLSVPHDNYYWLNILVIFPVR